VRRRGQEAQQTYRKEKGRKAVTEWARKRKDFSMSQTPFTNLCDE